MIHQLLNINADIVRTEVAPAFTDPSLSCMLSEALEVGNKKPIYQVQILPICAPWGTATWVTIHSSESLHNARTSLGMVNLGWMSEVVNARIRWVGENGIERTECGQK